ncbi:hypothetical protein [Actinoplanes sp. DH11]|uniref:hypothetical protein n=1 Tax=Actinoplanes sp. DH11 TaxID=2857011 RepID=UPI001E47C979|nr:hypothetical protein [Actinoplanes sp. DH11]
MRLAEVLDVIEWLLAAAGHPEIGAIGRYGTDPVAGGPSPAGVRVRYASGAEAYLWGAVWPREYELPTPAELPWPARADRIAVFTCRLLDAARPAEFRGWQLVALDGLGPADARSKAPRGIRVVAADGTSLLLRATASGAPMPEPAADPYPGYVIPETLSVRLLSRKAGAQPPDMEAPVPSLVAR